MKNPIIVAIDTKNLDTAIDLVKTISPHIGLVKLGLEFFTFHGSQGVRKIKEIHPRIFLDLKFHDIPNTVYGAVSSACELEIEMLTIHLSGGSEMIKAATRAASEAKTKPLILGVSVLTSMSDDNLSEIGVNNSAQNQVLKLAEIGKNNGIDGIVCSAHEIKSIKNKFDNLKIIVPGIRLEKSTEDDQKRVMSPKEALELGADYLVIGRPITGAKNPVEVVKRILL